MNASASGPNDGTSWANAFTDLQDALAQADTCGNITEIWVAAGTYTPTSTTDRTISFVMQNDLAILGGFPNTGNPTIGDRDWEANVTTLSGEIGAGGTGDNKIHIVKNEYNGLNGTAVLDEFTVTLGNANGSSDFYGGGMYNALSSPTVSHCIFSGNVGGGTGNSRCSPQVSFCDFVGNSSGSGGGGMYNYDDANPTVSDCNFTGNTANVGGGMFCNQTFNGPSATVIRCTFSGNAASSGSGIGNFHSSPTVTDCVSSQNAANLEGNGMYNYDGSSPNLTGCEFSDNTSNNSGGAIWNDTAEFVENSSSPLGQLLHLLRQHRTRRTRHGEYLELLSDGVPVQLFRQRGFVCRRRPLLRK